MLRSMGEDLAVFDTWYKEDINAVPPVFVLQQISSIIPSFKSKVVHFKLILQDYLCSCTLIIIFLHELIFCLRCKLLHDAYNFTSRDAYSLKISSAVIIQ